MNFNKFIENKNEKIFILCRGIPGSGKSFTAKEMLKKYGGGDPDGHIFSTDNYFIKDLLADRKTREKAGGFIDNQFEDELEKETYRKNWSGDKLRSAHDWNFKKFTTAIDQGTTPVIADNTFVTAKEAFRYVEYAEKAEYKIIIKEPTSPWWNDFKEYLNDKQKHGTELEDFARFLAGHHQGMAKKYGTNGNTHGVPLDAIRGMIRRWQPGLTVDDIMGRSDWAKNKK